MAKFKTRFQSPPTTSLAADLKQNTIILDAKTYLIHILFSLNKIISLTCISIYNINQMYINIEHH